MDSSLPFRQAYLHNYQHDNDDGEVNKWQEALDEGERPENGRIPFGRQMRDQHFQFASSFTPLNHGSFGAYPRLVRDAQDSYTTLAQARPCPFIVYDLPEFVDRSREAIAPLLGAPVDEVVFLPNATTGVNTVLRNLKFEENDVVVHFSTIYDSCEKTLASIAELSLVTCDNILLNYPIEDAEILRRLRERVIYLRQQGKNVKVAMFDTILTFPGARMPWEDLVKASRELGILSLIDGAHGIGHIDLTHLGTVSPDFFVSNCHKWLYTPRGCAVFYVPVRNQHLIRTSIPTSHGYESPIRGKSRFVSLFEFVATIDYTPYLCVPDALKFRQEVCGGEEAIRAYCSELALKGGQRVAQILETFTMDNRTHSITNCCFSNVLLPLKFPSNATSEAADFKIEDAEAVQKWLNITAVREFDTYLQLGYVVVRYGCG